MPEKVEKEEKQKFQRISGLAVWHTWEPTD
jgi:hypothetical protein